MNKTKIDWCDSTINPVVGCSRNCPYCYARIMCKRFGNKWGVNDFSKPVFFPERLKQLESKKPKSIFMDSMSDIAFWDEKWVRKTFEAIRRNPQHSYIFLTKSGYQGIYGLYFGERALWDEYDNCAENVFIGLSVTKQANFPCGKRYQFLSIEPILEPIIIPNNYNISSIQQIIIGAETGNRKGKVIPKKEWIDSLVEQADKFGIRVFMKESLKELMGTDFRQDELIWEVNK